jgi:hypothetical protein
MEERRIPETLEEAYRLRDEARSLPERDFYQEQVYRLRREEYRSRGIRTEISSRRRERQSAIEFSREMFFLEVAEIAGRSSGRRGGRAARAAQQEARRYATRLDTHAFLKQLASPHSGAVELYRRNYLELLRMGKSPGEAYYLSRVIGLVREDEFRRTLESVRGTGYPTKGRLAYTVEKAAIQIRDLPGGMILILLTFFASLFAFVWATKTWGGGPGTIFLVSLGLVAAGGLMLISAVFIITFIRSINK